MRVSPKFWFTAVVLIAVVALIIVFNFPKTPEVVTPTATVVHKGPINKIIGQSVEGRNIESYTYGKGDTHLLFVGGMHGGYEWNSVLLAYDFMDYLNSTPDAIPENITVTVIPELNIDGVYKVVGKEGIFTIDDVNTDKTLQASARFNDDTVDLNRNFDCHWQPKSTWQSKTVSAGTAAFSEPETAALRDFILKNHQDAVVFWHSQANAVYASECDKGVLPGTLDIMNAYAKAAKYPAVKSFDAYPVTGDSEGWLASIDIPAITVELQTHEMVEWDRNLAGIKALFNYYAIKKVGNE